MSVETLKPPVGTFVWCYFGRYRYRGKVVKHGTKFPQVEFKMKNGKVKRGRATVIPPGPIGVMYVGYLAQMIGPVVTEDTNSGR